MAFEITGKLHKKFDTEKKTESFQARDFVIETEGKYPQFVKFQCTQDRCSMVDGVEEGQEIKVSFDLRGREWQGKYFTNLNAWKIEAAQPMAQDEEYMNQDVPSQEKPMSESEDYEDLPF
ncbi:MAG: DUF3127 domain-containing protein [Chitinophagales bacterium]